MGNLVQDESGQVFYQEAGGILRPVTEAQAQTLHDNPEAADTFIRSANLGLTNMGTMIASKLSDDPKWAELNRLGHQEAEALQMAQPMAGLLGTMAPQVAAGLATAGYGPLATGAVEAGLGAMSSPEGSRAEGAIVGGLAGAGGVLIPRGIAAGGRLAGRAAENVELPTWLRKKDVLDVISDNPGGLRPGERQALDGFMPDHSPNPFTGEVDEAMPPAGGAAGAPGRPQRMSDRIAGAIDEAAGEPAPSLRVLEGNMTPEELYGYGVHTTDAQRKLLRARVGTDEFGDAMEALGREEATMSNPVLGTTMRRSRDAQKEAATRFVARELGVQEGQALTDPTLSGVVRGIGKRMDEIGHEMDGLPFDDTLRGELAAINEQATGPHGPLIKRITDEIEERAAKNGGTLNGQDWQIVRTRLSNTIDAGQAQGDFAKISDAGQVMETMTKAMEDRLPAALKVEMQQLRKKYAIAMTAFKGRSKDVRGQINPTTFYNNWKRPQSKKMIGTDDVGNFMNTMSTLSQPVVPDSGTARRLMQMGVQKVLPAVGLGGLGGFIFGG